MRPYRHQDCGEQLYRRKKNIADAGGELPGAGGFTINSAIKSVTQFFQPEAAS
jgi:hypothetical protein